MGRMVQPNTTTRLTPVLQKNTPATWKMAGVLGASAPLGWEGLWER